MRWSVRLRSLLLEMEGRGGSRQSHTNSFMHPEPPHTRAPKSPPRQVAPTSRPPSPWGRPMQATPQGAYLTPLLGESGAAMFGFPLHSTPTCGEGLKREEAPDASGGMDGTRKQTRRKNRERATAERKNSRQADDAPVRTGMESKM